MTKLFDRKTFFDHVRPTLFNGAMTQQQVDGMNFKLGVWEAQPLSDDLRHIAYPFATSYHETAKRMWPIEEYGRGAGMAYGIPDPITGQTYYGRGDVQLTWADNYKKATKELGLSGANDLYLHAAQALDPRISAEVMYKGMMDGWFTGNSLPDYFNNTKDDPVNARSIINTDVSKNGALVAGYHQKFLTAFQAAYMPDHEKIVNIDIVVNAPSGVTVKVNVVEGT